MRTFLNLPGLRLTIAALALLAGATAQAACRDAVVMVHGNAGYPSHFDATVSTLLSNGYSSSEIFRPNWGSKLCAACNDHNGSEEYPVRDAINAALSKSCTGKIDVIGHSMGVTLAMQQVLKLSAVSRVESFVGIAGAPRGLPSCGVYPFHVATTACGYYGLSVDSPFIKTVKSKRVGSRVYSLKSWTDEIVCATTCYLYGSHVSHMPYENSSITRPLGHMGLVLYTPSTQYSLIK